MSKRATSWKNNKKVDGAIGEEIADAMDEARAATLGSERMTKTSKAIIKVAKDVGTMTINWGNHADIYPFITLEETEDLAKEFLSDGVTVHELATDHPQIYWLLIHHVGFSEMEPIMDEWGVLQRRRKRGKK